MWLIENFEKTDCGVFDTRYWVENGDWEINFCRYIMDTNDKSEWAYDVFEINALALVDGYRWPECAIKYVTGRKRTDVTRDSYTYLYVCAIFLDRLQFIEWAKPPLRLYIPVFWAWRRYLIKRTKKSKWIKWYRGAWLFWEWISPSGKHEFALRLRDYRLSTK